MSDASPPGDATGVIHWKNKNRTLKGAHHTQNRERDVLRSKSSSLLKTRAGRTGERHCCEATSREPFFSTEEGDPVEEEEPHPISSNMSYIFYDAHFEKHIFRNRSRASEKSDDQFRHIGCDTSKVANSKQDRFGVTLFRFFFRKSAANININMSSVKKHLPSSRSKLIAFHDNHWQRPVERGERAV